MFTVHGQLDGKEVKATWDAGALVNTDESLENEIRATIARGEPVLYSEWSVQPTLEDEGSAQITLLSILYDGEVVS